MTRTQGAAAHVHRPRFIDYVNEQATLGDRLTRKRMFGEYALYVDGKVVAFACDNSLYVKPSAAAAKLAPGLPQRLFTLSACLAPGAVCAQAKEERGRGRRSTTE